MCACTDKATSLGRAVEAGAAIAETHLVRDVEELDIAADHLRANGHAMCVKPASGHGGLGFFLVGERPVTTWVDFREHEFGPEHITLGHLREVLRSHAEHARQDPLLLCEVLPGPEISVDCWAQGGRLAASVARLKRSRRYVPQSVLIDNPRLLEATEAVAEKLGLLQRNCVFNMQFRRSRSGVWCVQEANPRPSGGSHLAAAFGVNLVAAAAAFELGIELPPMVPQPSGSTVVSIPEALSVPAEPGWQRTLLEPA